MRRCIALAVLSAGLASAADIYGTLREGTNVRGNIPFQVLDTANRTIVNGRTESDGSFRFSLPGNGRFLLRVSYAGQSPTADIYSSPKPVQYDFELVLRDRTWVLMRR